eukprot:4215415-Heterocapsa_arctica.AAC.1
MLALRKALQRKALTKHSVLFGHDGKQQSYTITVAILAQPSSHPTGSARNRWDVVLPLRAGPTATRCTHKP